MMNTMIDQAAPAAANGSAAEPAAGEPAKKTVSCCFALLFCCFVLLFCFVVLQENSEF